MFIGIIHGSKKKQCLKKYIFIDNMKTWLGKFEHI